MGRSAALKALVSLGLGGLVFALGGCGGSSSSSSNARLRVVHAMPSVFVTVDVVADGSTTLFFQGLSYGFSTGYLDLAAGNHTIAVEPTGSTNTLVSTNLAATAGAHYTLVESGPSGSLSGQLLTDDLSVPSGGNFKLRVVDASPSGGAEDVYVTAPGADLNAATPTLSNIGFPSAAAYMNLAGGTYEIRMTAAGTKTVEADTGTLAFSAGSIRTAVLLDAPGGGFPLSTVVLADLN